MVEYDDYNSEYFFDKEYELEEYDSILEELYEPAPEDQDFAYNIFLLEQTNTLIKEIGEKSSNLRVSAGAAQKALQDLIYLYTEECGE